MRTNKYHIKKVIQVIIGFSKNLPKRSRHYESAAPCLSADRADEIISIIADDPTDRHTAFAMTKRVFRDALILISLLLTITSCQKVVELDLNSADPQMVVEASISNLPGPYIVKLSKTVNFTDINTIPPVSGATVVIADSIGHSDTLVESMPGIYKTKSLKGIPGQKYTLSITESGRTYYAISYMPYPVDIQKLTIVQEKQDRPSFGQRDTNEQRIRYQVNYIIADPVEYNNYYRFATFYKNRELGSRRVFDDQFHNGKMIADEFGLRDSAKFKPGDTVLVKLLSIDKATYNFFRTMREGAGGMGFLSASPANPITNLSGHALGYFSAYSEKDEFIIIPK